MLHLSHYFNNLQANQQHGGERSHYPTLKALIDNAAAGINAVIEEKGNQAGIPDFTIRKNNFKIGYIEAKDLGKSLVVEAKTKQLERYRESSIGQNLLFTNYLEFWWYLDGKLSQKVTIGKLEDNKILATENTEEFRKLLQGFLGYRQKDINNYIDLADQMASYTRTIRDATLEALDVEIKTDELNQLKNLFQELLLPDLDNQKFSDTYAQTIAYGLFTARIGHAQEPKKAQFNRQTASGYIGNATPFLKGLFNTIIETDVVRKIDWSIEDLIELFSQVDMTSVLERFGQETRRQDPVVHFYETFLAAYEASLRKSRGVYYTPEPIVSFIVKAVNNILDQDFDLPFGLGHRRVKILDPATGTGTFLYEVIKQVYRNFEKYGVNNWHRLFKDSQLLERLYGFELLMTPYTIAHLKLGLLLKNFGYQFDENERLNIYLTNALEEGIKESDLIVAKFLADESNQAAAIKTDMPIIVVLGNPPYSVSSQNASKRKQELNRDRDYLADVSYNGESWTKVYKKGKAGKIITELTHIGELLETYKGKVRLEGEKNIQPLDDDYIKFIRFAHNRIELTGYGIVAFITNHSYLNGLIHRGMREELLNYFDKLYVMDLHGNALLKETTPEGETDQNVFDIQQGVAILIGVRQKDEPDYFSTAYKDRTLPKQVAEVFYYDLWGKRSDKYHFLESVDFRDVNWMKLHPIQPNYFFAPKDFDLATEYTKNWSISDIFPVNSTGVKTHRDHFAIDFDLEKLYKRIKDFRDLSIDDEKIANIYTLRNTRDWKINIKRKLSSNDKDWENYFIDCLYRPFDTRFYYHNEDVVELTRNEVMKNMIKSENLGLILCRQQSQPGEWCLVSVTNKIIECCAISNKTREANYLFPLYLYPDTKNQQGNLFVEKASNFSTQFLIAIKEKLGYQPTPENIFYYAYAIFHSLVYRQRYAEFLKIDFPRLPLTSDKQLFQALAEQGEKLVALHLLKSPQLNTLITTYESDGNSQVTQVTYNDHLKRVYINPKTYFAEISPSIWKFKIGGYQVLEKWLKDRKKASRKLSDDDIIHYQKIVVALTETENIMQAIDKIIPGFPIV